MTEVSTPATARDKYGASERGEGLLFLRCHAICLSAPFLHRLLAEISKFIHMPKCSYKIKGKARTHAKSATAMNPNGHGLGAGEADARGGGGSSHRTNPHIIVGKL